MIFFHTQHFRENSSCDTIIIAENECRKIVFFSCYSAAAAAVRDGNEMHIESLFPRLCSTGTFILSAEVMKHLTSKFPRDPPISSSGAQNGDGNSACWPASLESTFLARKKAFLLKL